MNARQWSACGSADPGNRLPSAVIPWIGKIGHHRGDRSAVAAPAKDVLEQRLIAPKPVDIGDYFLRRRSLGFIPDVHDHQSSPFDPSEPLGHGPLLDRFGWSLATGSDGDQHPGPHVIEQERVPLDEVTNRNTNHLLHQPGHAVRSVQQHLPRVRLRPLGRGEAPLLANVQAFASLGNRRDEYLQVGVGGRTVAPPG
jgi:hypothetical protein